MVSNLLTKNKSFMSHDIYTVHADSQNYTLNAFTKIVILFYTFSK